MYVALLVLMVGLGGLAVFKGVQDLQVANMKVMSGVSQTNTEHRIDVQILPSGAGGTPSCRGTGA